MPVPGTMPGRRFDPPAAKAAMPDARHPDADLPPAGAPAAAASAGHGAASRRWWLAGAAASGLLSLACWALYFTLYWPWRDLFDAEGRHFDERSAVVYSAQSATWGLPAAVFLLAALAMAGLALRRPEGGACSPT